MVECLVIRIDEIVWKAEILEKIERKHGVSEAEVEEILLGTKKVYRVERGNVKGEDLYQALGKTASGRHLSIFFVFSKQERAALPISARDMDSRERKRYEGK